MLKGKTIPTDYDFKTHTHTHTHTHTQRKPDQGYGQYILMHKGLVRSRNEVTFSFLV